MPTFLENKLLNSYKEEIIPFIETNPQYFDEAVKLAIRDNQPYSWRAAWLLCSCMEENDKRIKKYLNKIINAVKNKDDGHQRELLKILYKMELNEDYEGILFDICMDIWEQVTKSPSVRINALKMIIKIAKKHPQLTDEISCLLQEPYLESLSRGAKHSAAILMNQLKR